MQVANGFVDSSVHNVHTYAHKHRNTLARKEITRKRDRLGKKVKRTIARFLTQATINRISDGVNRNNARRPIDKMVAMCWLIICSDLNYFFLYTYTRPPCDTVINRADAKKLNFRSRKQICTTQRIVTVDAS